MNDSLDTVTSGLFFNHDEDAAVNGPTASACCVVLSVVVSGGSGMPRITSGRRSTRSNRSDGFTSMLAKKLGIILGSTVKVRTPPSPTSSSNPEHFANFTERLGQENVLLHRLLHGRRHRRDSPLRA